MDHDIVTCGTGVVPARQVRRWGWAAAVCAVSLLAHACALASPPGGRRLAASPGAQPVELNTGTSAVVLQPLASGEGAAARLGAALKSLRPGQQVYLHFQGVTAARAGAVYDIYLNLPSDAPPRGVTDARYLGSLSLNGVSSEAPTDISINITPFLQRMSATGGLDGEMRVALVPAGQPDPSEAASVQRVVLALR